MVWSLDQEAAAAGRAAPAASRVVRLSKRLPTSSRRSGLVAWAGSSEPGDTKAIRKVPPRRGVALPGSPERVDRWVQPAVSSAHDRTSARTRPRALHPHARPPLGTDPYPLGARRMASSTLVMPKTVAAPTVSLSRLRSTTVEPPRVVLTPPPNMSDSPPPRPAWSRMNRTNVSDAITWTTITRAVIGRDPSTGAKLTRRSLAAGAGQGWRLEPASRHAGAEAEALPGNGDRGLRQPHTAAPRRTERRWHGAVSGGGVQRP